MQEHLGPHDYSQIFGVINELHRLKIGDMGDDPFTKLGAGHVSILNPMASLVIKGHAIDVTRATHATLDVFQESRIDG